VNLQIVASEEIIYTWRCYCCTVFPKSYTWEDFRKMLDLICYLFNQQESWTLDAQILFAALCEHCKAYISGHAENHTDMNQLEKFMKELNVGDIDFTQRQECKMDVERAFYEMKYFCSFDTMGNI
jgi:hypothetical protein